MRSLCDADFLALWESGCRRHPLDRAVLTLRTALAESSYEQLVDWPLGRRNLALAEIHRRSFGESLHGWLSCTGCGEKLEFELHSELLTGAGSAEDGVDGLDAPIVVDGRAFRLPNSRDLAQAAREKDPRLAAIRIVEQCRIEPDDSPDWTDVEIEKIGARMLAADPLAETLVSLKCAHCGKEWQETLDLMSFLWAEIEARARRVLRDIHALASAYGWTETQILALTPQRRARYVEMVDL